MLVNHGNERYCIIMNICNNNKYLTHTFAFIPGMKLDFESRWRLSGIILSLKKNYISSYS